MAGRHGSGWGSLSQPFIGEPPLQYSTCAHGDGPIFYSGGRQALGARWMHYGDHPDRRECLTGGTVATPTEAVA